MAVHGRELVRYIFIRRKRLVVGRKLVIIIGQLGRTLFGRRYIGDFVLRKQQLRKRFVLGKLIIGRNVLGAYNVLCVLWRRGGIQRGWRHERRQIYVSSCYRRRDSERRRKNVYDVYV